MAARGAGAVRPLHGEHVHRQGVGRRHRELAHLQSRPARRPAVGPRGEARRVPQPDPHGQAPRRLLPLADATTDHSVRSSPGAADRRLVREFIDACRAEGLGAGLYLSPWDRNARSYGQWTGLRRLLSRRSSTSCSPSYGPLVEVWFDGANGEGPNGKRQAYDWPRIHASCGACSRKAVMFSDAGPTCAGSATSWRGRHDLLVHGRSRARAASRVRRAVGAVRAEAGRSGWHRLAPGRSGRLDPAGWFWHPAQDERVRSADNLMRLYFRSVGRNSKLLLNVPPTRDGLFHDRDVQASSRSARTPRAVRSRRARRRPRAASGGSRPAPSSTPTPTTTGGRPWTTSGWLEVELPAAATFDTLRLEEAIEAGQHIANHVEAWRETAGRRWRGHHHRQCPAAQLRTDDGVAHPRGDGIRLRRAGAGRSAASARGRRPRRRRLRGTAARGAVP